MFETLLSVLPIFGLVVTGFIAKRLLPSSDLWKGIEALVYYLFFVQPKIEAKRGLEG